MTEMLFQSYLNCLFSWLKKPWYIAEGKRWNKPCRQQKCFLSSTPADTKHRETSCLVTRTPLTSQVFSDPTVSHQHTLPQRHKKHH